MPAFLEERYRRKHLNCVRHITLDPKGHGVVRIHMIPPRQDAADAPFLLLLNGDKLVPLNLSWAILLANFMDRLEPFAGLEISESDWHAMAASAVAETRKTYPFTPKTRLAGDLELMLTSLVAIARGQEPAVEVGTLSLGDYAAEMTAPHRMDLMLSAMRRSGVWHCNQKCLHCYAAGQSLADAPELSTQQWLDILRRLREANIPQVTFTGGEPTLRADLPELVDAAQWFVTRLNTNGQLLTPELCAKLYDASLDSVQVTLYSADPAIHNALVGVDGFDKTVQGIRNAVAAGLIVSVNTPLCSLNTDYAATLRFAASLGVRYATCSGLIPSGSGEPRYPPDGAGAHRRAARRRLRAGGAEHGAGLHQPGLAAGGDAARSGPAPDPQLRRLPEQHGHRAGRQHHPLPELAQRRAAGQYAHRRLVRRLEQRPLRRHPRGECQNGSHLSAAHRQQGGGDHMLKKLRILLLALLTALCCTVTAWADYDYIDRYDVTAAPNVDDGSLTITVDLTWTALEELPYGQELKIGVPNGSVRDEEALTDNIERLSFDNSYMYVYLDRAYRQGETFTFSYRWVQEYMYTLSGNTVTFDYTPGWFDEARVGEMTLKWIDPAGLIGDLTAAADAGGTAAPQTGMMTITASDLGYGETMGVHAVYTDWPTVLSSDNSAVNAPNDGWYDGDEDEDTSMAGMFLTLIITIFIVWVVVRILRALFGGYAGGFGTRYVFVNHLWYPAGPDGRPRPGSKGTKRRPRPPRSGGSGFGGGSHCACASSCACACACACAGGGRAGCSAKNLYGAVKLDETLSEKLDA